MTSPSIFYVVVRPRSLKIRGFSCSFDIATGVELINSFNNSALVVLYIFKGHYILFFSPTENNSVRLVLVSQLLLIGVAQ